jgi:anti-sigma B factor antagonist
LDGAVGILRLQGEVRAELVACLHEAASALRDQGARHVIVDFGGVVFIDSASVGEILRLEKDLGLAGGVVVLYALPRVAQRVLEVTGLANRFRIAPDEPRARAMLPVA